MISFGPSEETLKRCVGGIVAAAAVVFVAVCICCTQQQAKTADNVAIDLTKGLCAPAEVQPIGQPWVDIVCTAAEGTEDVIAQLNAGDAGTGQKLPQVVHVHVAASLAKQFLAANSRKMAATGPPSFDSLCCCPTGLPASVSGPNNIGQGCSSGKNIPVPCQYNSWTCPSQAGNMCSQSVCAIGQICQVRVSGCAGLVQVCDTGCTPVDAGGDTGADVACVEQNGDCSVNACCPGLSCDTTQDGGMTCIGS